jgi:hypothetical protein
LIIDWPIMAQPALPPMKPVAGLVGQIIDDRGGHQGFKQAHGGHGGGDRQDDLEGLEIERDIRQQEDRQGRGQFTHIADRAHVEAERHGDGGQREDADQRRGDGLRHIGKQVDDRQSGGDHHIGQPRHAEQLGELGHENQDGQCVHETGHDRARDEAHHVAELEHARGDLDQPRQHRGREQILKPVFLDQGHHQDGGRRRRGGDHARAPARKRADHRDREGCIQPDLGVDPGDDGKGNGLWNKRQGDDQPREDIGAYVAEPLFAIRGK